MTDKSLARQVAKREALIEKTIKDVYNLVHKYGKRIFYEEHSCHTTSTHELLRFGGVSFNTHGSFTMFGGERISIWQGETLVFEVECNPDTAVKAFVNNGWEKAFARVVKNADKIDAKRKAAELKQKEAAEAARQRLISNAALSQKAKKLGLA